MRTVIHQSQSLQEIISELLLELDPDYPMDTATKLPLCVEVLASTVLFHALGDIAITEHTAIDRRFKRYVRLVRFELNNSERFAEIIRPENRVYDMQTLHSDGTFKLRLIS